MLMRVMLTLLSFFTVLIVSMILFLSLIHILNPGRLLYIICLLTISVVGGNLKAQTIVKHQIGFDIRPG